MGITMKNINKFYWRVRKKTWIGVYHEGAWVLQRYKISPDYYKDNIAPHLEKLTCKNSKKNYVFNTIRETWMSGTECIL